MPRAYHEEKIAGLDVVVAPGDEGGYGIIMFHGFGADAFDLTPLRQVHNEYPRPTWYFPHAPEQVEIAPGYFGRAWFPIEIQRLRNALDQGNQEEIMNAFPTDLGKIRGKAEHLIAELDIPLSKLYLGGFSQGAVLATDIALHAKENCAGLILLSGTLINKESWKQLALQHKGLPYFMSHGDQDPILPIQGAIELEKLLKESGLKGNLHTFRGGHEIPHSLMVPLLKFLQQ